MQAKHPDDETQIQIAVDDLGNFIAAHVAWRSPFTL
jgi:hypothetical protein